MKPKFRTIVLITCLAATPAFAINWACIAAIAADVAAAAAVFVACGGTATPAAPVAVPACIQAIALAAECAALTVLACGGE